jgi:FixJ family two-component response regulator
MGAGDFLKKPYTYQDFGRAVRTELEACPRQEAQRGRKCFPHER